MIADATADPMIVAKVAGALVQLIGVEREGRRNELVGGSSEIVCGDRGIRLAQPPPDRV